MDIRQALAYFREASSSVPYFSLRGIETFGRVVSVHDNYFDVVIPIFYTSFKFRCRLENQPLNAFRNIEHMETFLSFITHVEPPSCDIHRCVTRVKRKAITEYLYNTKCIVWVECGEFNNKGIVQIKLKRTPIDPESFLL